MVASETYAEFLREQLAPLGRVTLRGMFGKTGVFCDGVMLGMVTENTLYFRVDDENRETFREAEAFPPLNYAKKGQMIDLAFWRVRSGCSTNPMNSSLGRAPRWRRHTGLRRRGRRQSSPKHQGNANAHRERPKTSGRSDEVALRCLAHYPAAAFTAIGEASSPLSSNFRGNPAKPRSASAIFARPLTPVITTSTIIKDVWMWPRA
jgi:DNA transformation protein and related proteins